LVRKPNSSAWSGRSREGYRRRLCLARANTMNAREESSSCVQCLAAETRPENNRMERQMDGGVDGGDE
jgi:hypothetical protein